MQLPQTIEVKGIRVLTSKQLAECYEATVDIIKKNYSNNRKRFAEGKHYLLLQGEELKSFKNKVKNVHLVNNEGGNSRLVEKNAKILYLWTEKGALLHAKSLNTDKAWEVYDYLVDYYFRQQEAPAAAGRTELAQIKEIADRTHRTGERLVDIRGNKTAMTILEEMRRYLTAMEALMEIYSRPNTDQRIKGVMTAMDQVVGRIRDKKSELKEVRHKYL